MLCLDVARNKRQVRSKTQLVLRAAESSCLVLVCDGLRWMDCSCRICTLARPVVLSRYWWMIRLQLEDQMSTGNRRKQHFGIINEESYRTSQLSVAHLAGCKLRLSLEHEKLADASLPARIRLFSAMSR